VIWAFAAVLVVTGLKTAFGKDGGEKEARLDRRRDVRLLRRVLGKHTLLLLVAVIELTDVVFAFDSIPAVLAVTRDPFIVYSSNLLAILGLRSLFFALEGALQRLDYLQHGLGVLLVLIGVKMAIGEWVHLPAWVSLA